MKRPLTLLKVLTAAVAVIALFTDCKQFLDDPEDFFGYWASETFVKSHNISSAHRPDGAGVQCVGCSVYGGLSGYQIFLRESYDVYFFQYRSKEYDFIFYAEIF